jgi:hypothetical protein
MMRMMTMISGANDPATSRDGGEVPVVTVTGPDGRKYLVDTQNLRDPNEPSDNYIIGETTDNQLFQKVDGKWYRLLRTDEVDYNTVIAPKGKRALAWAYGLGRDVNYSTAVTP